MSTQSSGEPNVELIVGAYRSGKTDSLLHNLIEYSRSSAFANSLLLVPSARYRELLNDKLKRLLAAQANGKAGCGIFGLRILTFYEACKLVLQTCGVGYRLMPEKMRPAVLAKVLADVSAAGKLSALAPIAALPGTHAAVLQLIDELERAALSPSDVAGRVKRTAADESRYTELSRVYEAYWDELERSGHTDEKRLAFTARELLFAQADGLRLGWFGVDGFDRLSPLQIHVIKGFCNLSARSFITFDYVESGPLGVEYQWKEECYRQLISEISGVNRKLLPLPAARETERSMFSALDRLLEMDEIARNCKRYIHQGCPADQLLVIARDLAPYRGAIEAAFDKAGVPYFVDAAVDLRELPVVQLVQRLLSLHAAGLARADVIACLRSPFIMLSELQLDRRLVEYIDKESWDCCVVGGKADWDRCRERLGAAGTAVARFIELTRPPSAQHSLTRFCEWAEKLLSQLVHWGDEGRKLDDYDPRLALAEVRKSLAYLIQQEQIFGEKPVEYEHFLKLLSDLLEGGNYRRPRPQQPVVTICGAELAPNTSFDHIFLAGMVEGEFPRRTGLSGFVSNEEVLRWASFGIDISNPRYHPAFEQALYLSLLQRARRSIHLSFPRYEMDGEEVVPSFLLSGASEQSMPYVPPYRGSSVAPVSADDAVSGRLWNGHEPEEASFNDHRINTAWLALEPQLAMSRARLRQARENLSNGYLKDLVRSGALRMVAPSSFSISGLNDYGKCPFRYWTGRVLRLQPRLEHETGLDEALRGQAFHKALELFYSKLQSDGLHLQDLNADQMRPRVEEACASAFAWLESQDEFHPGEFWSREKEDMVFRLRRLILLEAERAANDEYGFQPAMFELRFGSKQTDNAPPLVLFPDEPIEIGGIIDRLDFADAGSQKLVRVIDYKTGTAAISEREAREGRNLQLPVYALAVQNAVMPGSRVSHGIYISVNAGKPIGKIDFTSDKAQDILPVVQQHIRNYVRGIKDGVFTVMPNGDVCDNCDHRQVCRIAELNRQGGQEVSIEYAD